MEAGVRETRSMNEDQYEYSQQNSTKLGLVQNPVGLMIKTLQIGPDVARAVLTLFDMYRSRELLVNRELADHCCWVWVSNTTVPPYLRTLPFLARNFRGDDKDYLEASFLRTVIPKATKLSAIAVAMRTEICAHSGCIFYYY